MATDLPMAGERRERADAAENRRRILRAARTLLKEQGVEGFTMQAVAAAAGVGKGTVFHRFGDRDGLTAALIDEHMREFQDLFLHGPPPLGPGAPARERLEAFVVAFISRQTENLEVALVAERVLVDVLSPADTTLLIHVAALIAEIRPDLDSTVVAALLLSAIAPPVLYRMHKHGGIAVADLQTAALALLRGI